jgi:hypothetical protein
VGWFLYFSFHYYNKVVTSQLGGKIRNFSIIGKSFKTKVFFFSKSLGSRISFPPIVFTSTLF